MKPKHKTRKQEDKIIFVSCTYLDTKGIQSFCNGTINLPKGEKIDLIKIRKDMAKAIQKQVSEEENEEQMIESIVILSLNDITSISTD